MAQQRSELIFSCELNDDSTPVELFAVYEDDKLAYFVTNNALGVKVALLEDIAFGTPEEQFRAKMVYFPLMQKGIRNFEETLLHGSYSLRSLGKEDLMYFFKKQVNDLNHFANFPFSVLVLIILSVLL